MAGYIELFIDKGTDFVNIINITDTLTGNVTNVSGYSVRSKMRRSYYNANVAETFLCTITDAANGQITMSLANANTANLKPGRYVFDVETVTPAGAVARILEGIIIVTPEATR